MRPTRVRDLVLLAVVAGAVVLALLLRTYEDLPPLPVAAGIAVAVVGLAELFVAPAIRARIVGRPGTRPIMPIAVARTAVMAKASSLVGALTAGGWAGALLYVLPRLGDFPTARTDSVAAGLGCAAGVILVVGALRLEHACRVPDPPDGRRRR